MSEAFEKIRVWGRVQKLLSDRKAGFITPDQGTDDLYFVAQQVEGDKFEILKQGDTVTFTIGKSKDGRQFANEVALAKEEDNNTFSGTETRLTGWVKTLLSHKPAGFIRLDGSTQDFYFVAQQVEDDRFEALKQGDVVTFTIGKGKDGKQFANKVQLSLDSFTDKNNLPAPQLTVITCEELKRQIIEQFKRILLTTNPSEFEDLVFLLLRTLGIHSLYQYDKRNQAGRADGFFVIGNLAVMYDCTLRQSFEEYKKDQIENYVNKLEQAQLTFDLKSSDGAKRKKTLKISGKSTQVWIITTGQTREISNYGDIKVKEVSVNDLIWLLQMKLNMDAIEEDDLALNLLSRIEKVIPG
ncbi:cold shock domain-containing protein [Trichocoleus sp. ST-U3]